MRFYNRQHGHHCGIDLHVKTMYARLLDAASQVVVHRNVPSTPAAFLELVAPCRVGGVHVRLVLASRCLCGRRDDVRARARARDESDSWEQVQEQQDRRTEDCEPPPAVTRVLQQAADPMKSHDAKVAKINGAAAEATTKATQPPAMERTQEVLMLEREIRNRLVVRTRSRST